MASLFRGVLEFLDQIGVYDVLLPFILVFAIVFAILDKSKVLGTEKDQPKRNLNSLVAFAVAFFTVASSRLVATINQALAHIVVLIIASVFFLIMIGTFHEEGKPIALKGGWKTTGMVIMFVGIVLIFLDALKTKTNVSWLEWTWDYATTNWNGTVMGTIIFLAILIGGIVWLTKSPSEKKESKEEDE